MVTLAKLKLWSQLPFFLANFTWQNPVISIERSGIRHEGERFSHADFATGSGWSEFSGFAAEPKRKSAWFDRD